MKTNKRGRPPGFSHKASIEEVIKPVPEPEEVWVRCKQCNAMNYPPSQKWTIRCWNCKKKV